MVRGNIHRHHRRKIFNFSSTADDRRRVTLPDTVCYCLYRKSLKNTCKIKTFN